MKSSVNTRKEFKERIVEALKISQDSEELKNALSIVDDLNDVLEIIAVASKYICVDTCDDYYSGSNYGSTGKTKEVLDKLLHSFIGIDVLDGDWINTHHWLDKLSKDTISKHSVSTPAAPSHSPTHVVNFPSYFPSSSSPILSPAPKPAHPYLDSLKKILEQATNNNLTLVTVTHKANNDFKLSTPKNTIYLNQCFVTGIVTIKNTQTRQNYFFSDSDLDAIAKIVKVELF